MWLYASVEKRHSWLHINVAVGSSCRQLCLKTSVLVEPSLEKLVAVCLLCQLTVRQHGSRLVGQRGRRPEQKEEETASPLVFLFLFVLFVVRQPGGQQPEPEVQSPEPLSLQRPRQEVKRASEPLNCAAGWVQPGVSNNVNQGAAPPNTCLCIEKTSVYVTVFNHPWLGYSLWTCQGF